MWQWCVASCTCSAVIRDHTLRGQHLDTHPVMLVGADFNQEALVATADHFRQKEVKGHLLWGDIGDPDQLAFDLFEMHGVRLGDLLSVRSFLDHNRIYNPQSWIVQTTLCRQGRSRSEDSVSSFATSSRA